MKFYNIDMKLKYGDGYLLPRKNKLDEFDIDVDDPLLLSAIGKSDIFRRIMGLNIFSEKLRNLLENSGSFKFQRIKIFFKGGLVSDQYFIFDVTETIDLIDYENSEIHDLPFYDKLKFLEGNISPNSYIVMDKTDDLYCFYTEKFIKLIKEYKLDVDFSEVDS